MPAQLNLYKNWWTYFKILFHFSVQIFATSISVCAPKVKISDLSSSAIA